MVDELTLTDRESLNVFDKLILVEDHEIPFFKSWIFRLDVVEASTAVKPFALCLLLEEFSHVTYLDPDIIVYSRLDELFLDDGDWDISLTPHQTQHQNDSWLIESTELESARWGIYNLGFLSVKSTSNGKKIASWWKDRCYSYCMAEPERGLFTDQRLFDAAPALFDGVRILKHPGYNVATWNISHRKVTFLDSELKVNGLPLRFCHFTKASHIGAHALQRMTLSDNYFEDLFYSYVAQLQHRKEVLKTTESPWHYGFYANGVAVEKSDRVKHRRNRNFFDVTNPFKVVEAK